MRRGSCFYGRKHLLVQIYSGVHIDGDYIRTNHFADNSGVVCLKLRLYEVSRALMPYECGMI